jgi:hypothetical protein
MVKLKKKKKKNRIQSKKLIPFKLQEIFILFVQFLSLSQNPDLIKVENVSHLAFITVYRKKYRCRSTFIILNVLAILFFLYEYIRVITMLYF